MAAPKNNYQKDAKMMIKNDAPLDIKDNDGHFPLNLALLNIRTHFVAIDMVKAGANTNDTNFKKITGHNQIKFILEYNKSPNKAIK